MKITEGKATILVDDENSVFYNKVRVDNVIGSMYEQRSIHNNDFIVFWR